MDTETIKTESGKLAEEPAVPTVIAKKREPADALGKDQQNAAEMARLAKWATGDCGKPILAD